MKSSLKWIIIALIAPQLLWAENLIQNSGFDQGNTGFTTGYTLELIDRLYDEEYRITSNPADAHNRWINTEDHSGTNGNMLVANGSLSTNTVVWQQTISVQTNKQYIFSAWAINVMDQTFSTGNEYPGTFRFYINGAQLDPEIELPAAVSSPDHPPWQNYSASWSNNVATNATLTIRMTSDHFSGNDFAIDDLSFHRYLPEVTVPPGIGRAIAVRWQSIRHQFYQIQWCESISSNTWFSLGRPMRGNGRMMEGWDTIPASGNARFYRVLPIE